ncbi:hypothetical protein DSO57_1015260 [Entomophthora muscae]|nr:hypothetical protein DSO57_1015260 [Entomophthora muscae]
MFNILQKDLRSNNEHIVVEALKALLWLPECDLVSDNLTLVLSILAPDTEPNHFVAKKVLQVVHRVLKHRGESGSGLGIPHSQLVQLILFGLKQKALYSTSLCLAKVAVLSPNFPVRAIIFSVTGVLSKLISDGSCHSPWVQTRCLEIMSLVSPSNPSLSRIFFPLVIDCLQNASKFPGLAIIVACAQAIGSMTLGSVDGVEKSFEFVNDLMRLLFVRDLLSRKAALRMLVFLLPHHSCLRVEEYESFLFSEVKEKSIEAVRLGVSIGINQRLSEAIASACSISFSVEALKAMVKMGGYSDQTISCLLRIFRHHFPLPTEKPCSAIQALEYCLEKCSTHHSAAPFRILLLTATHYIFSNPSSYITYALSKHHRILIYALSIINLESNITNEILAIESLWVFLHHFEYAFQKNASQLRQHLDLFKSPLKYVIIKKLEGLGTWS